VECRPEFGNRVFYVRATQFAALTDRAVLMHLAAADLTDVLRRRIAKPFVSAGAMGRNGWVENRFEATVPDDPERLLSASHAAARHSNRRTRPRHPSRARRRRSTR
jgi:hypothetical protein